MSTTIQATGLVKSYGNRKAVNGIDISIAKGETVAIIGPNGAGKSTLLDLLLGLKLPDAGSVMYGSDQPKRQIGVQLQTTPFFPGFTALENLRMMAAFYGLRPSKQSLLSILESCHLGEVSGTIADRLSGGQQKRLAIAMALIHQPQLLFLDEPTAALDPAARRDIRTLIQSLADTGTSIVFTSHDMEEVRKLASRIIMIQAGRIMLSGSPEELITNYDVTDLDELYLQLTESGGV